MPMYDFMCRDCGSVTSRFRKIVDRNDPLQCSCKGDMNIAILSAPAAKVQEECHYVCPVTGEQTTSWRQRKNTFAKHGLQAADPDQNKESMDRSKKKKAERDRLAANYLPEELKVKLNKIGANGSNPLDRFHVG